MSKIRFTRFYQLFGHRSKIKLNLTARFRKPLLIICASINILAAASLLLLPSRPFAGKHLIGAALNLVASTNCIICSTCHDAYLPILARIAAQHTDGGSGKPSRSASKSAVNRNRSFIQEVLREGEEAPLLDQTINSPQASSENVSALIAVAEPNQDQFEVHSKRLSATGTALSYGTTMIALIGSSGLVAYLEDSSGSLQVVIALTGIWWALALIPAIWYLPGGGLREESHIKGEDNLQAQQRMRGQVSNLPTLAAGSDWRRLGKLFLRREMGRLPNLYLFLWVFLLFSIGGFLHFNAKSVFGILLPYPIIASDRHF